MRISPIQMYNQGKLISDYRAKKSDIMEFFEYTPSGNLDQRLKNLKTRTFQRESLMEVLHKINNNWGAPDSTLHNIDRILDENSVVVIAGQQAGLLTGPLYTLNKVISILQLARQQEEKLQVPVIPVFWIAGEDHDFDEINHIFMQEELQLKKSKVGQQVRDKRSVSEIMLEKETIRKWLHQNFSKMEETIYTEDLYHVIENCLEKSDSYTDFFAQLIFKLFPNEGLVLVDSHHPLIRNLERDHFVDMIQKQSEISRGVHDSIQKLKWKGYSVPLEVEKEDANLFYHLGTERVLLIRDDKGNWIGKQNEVVFSTEELLQIAKQTPEKLSNNVVTRPLMQELLFPSLAFIGGPGEISYWSALKPVFEAFNMKMPPVFPRLSFTYIDPKVNKVLSHFNLTAEEVINYGVEEFRRNWIESKTKPPIQELAGEIKKTIEIAHKPLRDLAKDIRADIGDLAQKNLSYLQKDITFLEGRMLKAIEDKYEKELNEMDLLKLHLHPDGIQERIWNPLPLFNKFGTEFVKKTMTQRCSFQHDHYLVYL